MHIKLVTGTLLLAVAAPAYAEAWDFVLVNKTGKTIEQVELSPSGSESWSKWETLEDRPSTIGPGVDYTVHFTKEPKACQFDVRLKFKDDENPAVARGLNVCNYAFADFSFKDGELKAKGN